jgi:hypothetical protein
MPTVSRIEGLAPSLPFDAVWQPLRRGPLRCRADPPGPDTRRPRMSERFPLDDAKKPQKQTLSPRKQPSKDIAPPGDRGGLPRAHVGRLSSDGSCRPGGSLALSRREHDQTSTLAPVCPLPWGGWLCPCAERGSSTACARAVRLGLTADTPVTAGCWSAVEPGCLQHARAYRALAHVQVSGGCPISHTTRRQTSSVTRSSA